MKTKGFKAIMETRKKAEDKYCSLNILQRHEMVGQFAKDVITKLGNEAVTKQREDEIYQKAYSDGVTAGFLVAVAVIWGNWRALLKKSTRLEVFCKLFQEKLKYINTPDKEQLDAEAEFTKQTGKPIER